MSNRDESTTALIEQLASQDPEIRAFAVFRLGGRPESVAVGALGNALRDEDHEVREFAAQSLAIQREVAYLPVILELLREEAGTDVNPIAWAAATLAPMANEGLRDKTWDVLTQLADRASPQVQEQLKRLLDHK